MKSVPSIASLFWMFIPVVLLAAVVVVSDDFGSTTSNVLVHIPFSLHDPNGYMHVWADYGHPAFAASSFRSLSTYTYYYNSTLCEYSYPDYEEWYPKTSGGHGQFPFMDGKSNPFILIVNDGNCSAVTKSRNAQSIGAAALVIADGHCRCSNTVCTQKFPNEKCLEEDPALVDDGTGAEIYIPTFLIYKILSHNLKEQLTKNQPVLMELQWGIPAPDMEHSKKNVPKFSFWTSAYDPMVSIDLYNSIHQIHLAFGDAAEFAPKYNIIPGTIFQCDKNTDEHGPCDHLCTNHGRYCTLHARDLSGFAIVRETVRRLCLWKHYSTTQWWDYILYHKTNCEAPHLYADAKCLDSAFHHAKIDTKMLDECMTDAGDINADTTNALLDTLVEEHGKSSVVTLPAIAVNSRVLPWTSSRTLLDTMCSQFIYSETLKVPHICETCMNCINTDGCLEQGHCVDFSNSQRHPSKSGDGGANNKSSSTKKKRGWKIFFTLVILLLAGMGGWHHYKTRIAFGGNQDHSSLLNNYLQIGTEE